MNELISINEAAKLANRSRTAVHRWVAAGEIDIAYRGTEANAPIYLSRHDFMDKLPILTSKKPGRPRKNQN